MPLEVHAPLFLASLNSFVIRGLYIRSYTKIPLCSKSESISLRSEFFIPQGVAFMRTSELSIISFTALLSLFRAIASQDVFFAIEDASFIAFFSKTSISTMRVAPFRAKENDTARDAPPAPLRSDRWLARYLRRAAL